MFNTDSVRILDVPPAAGLGLDFADGRKAGFPGLRKGLVEVLHAEGEMVGSLADLVWSGERAPLLVVVQLEGMASLLAHENDSDSLRLLDRVLALLAHPEHLRVEAHGGVKVLDPDARVRELRFHGPADPMSARAIRVRPSREGEPLPRLSGVTRASPRHVHL